MLNFKNGSVISAHTLLGEDYLSILGFNLIVVDEGALWTLMSPSSPPSPPQQQKQNLASWDVSYFRANQVMPLACAASSIRLPVIDITLIWYPNHSQRSYLIDDLTEKLDYCICRDDTSKWFKISYRGLFLLFNITIFPSSSSNPT